MQPRITPVAATRTPNDPVAPRARRALTVATLAAIGALASSACVRTAASATNDADSTAVPVVAHTVTRSTRAWSTTTSGIVYANTTVDVAFEVPGKVISAGPDEGQPVHAGQTIAAVDPAEYRLAVEQAGAQADRTARDRDRNRPLLASGGISAADMDHLETGARQNAAAAGLAKKRLGDTRLTSPISGIIARRAIEVGATVTPGQPVYTIVDLDPVRVRVGVPESDIGHITEGAAAAVRIPALDTSFAGRVSLIGVAADPTTRSYTVEISVPNPTRRLRAGMVAEATITTRAMTSAIVVPAAAVLHDGSANGATIVYAIDRDAPRAHARRVTTGAAHGDSLEITAGVAPNDRIIVAGQHRLRDGARVRTLGDNETTNDPTGSAKP